MEKKPEQMSLGELQEHTKELERKVRDQEKRVMRHTNPWSSFFAELGAAVGVPQPENTSEFDCFYEKEKE